jgi:hypothetical protein
MIAGCQVAIFKDGTFVRNSSVVKDLKEAVSEARAYVDGLLAENS